MAKKGFKVGSGFERIKWNGKEGDRLTDEQARTLALEHLAFGFEDLSGSMAALATAIKDHAKKL